MGYVCGHRQQPSDQQHMGTAFTPAKTCPASWDAVSDVDAFVDAVLVELAAMAGTRPTVWLYGEIGEGGTSAEEFRLV